MMADEDLRQHLIAQLRGGQAFDRFEQIVAEVPAESRYAVPAAAERSPWQIVEHMRFSLLDIVEFIEADKGGYVEKAWPAEYWPKASGPADGRDAWAESVQGFLDTRTKLEEIVLDLGRDLFPRVPSGDGQTLLREILLAADHAAYHCGELVLLTRWLNAHS